MALEVILPRIDMDMTEGRISAWMVAEGDRVEKGQPIFEIETDKAAMEIDAPEAGVIRGLDARLDTPIPVGTAVAWICAEGEVFDPATPAAATPGTDAPPPPQAPPLPPAGGEGRGEGGAAAPGSLPLAVGENLTAMGAAAPGPLPLAVGEDRTAMGAAAPGPIRATPAARRRARDLGVTLAKVVGSGPAGRIQRADVGQAAPRVAAPAPSGAVSIRQLREGTGDPLLLIHGFGAEIAAWRAFVGRIAAPNPVFALDLPGHGASAPVAGGFAEIVAAVEDAVLAAAFATDLGRLHLAGHSLGGAVAAALAGGGALDARSLFLIAPAGLAPADRAAFIDPFCAAVTPQAMAAALAALVADPTALPPAMVRAALAARARDGGAALRALAASLFGDDAPALSIGPTLARASCPVRIVVGARDAVIASQELSAPDPPHRAAPPARRRPHAAGGGARR